MAWYRVGVCNLINGSVAVSGVGTAWVANAQPGDQLRGPDYSAYEIGSVNSDLSITLAEPYRGTTAAGQAYAIAPTQGRVRDLAAQVLALINSYSAVLTGAGAGLFQDGTVSTPGMSFASDPDCGWYRIGANNIGLATGGVLRVNFDASGNVGIGGAPTNKLDVFHTVTGIGARVRNTSTGIELAIRTDAATAGLDAGNTTGGITLSINSVEKARLDTSGNLGLGTVPVASNGQLQLTGNIGFAGVAWAIGYQLSSQSATIAGAANSPLFGVAVGTYTGFSGPGLGLHGYYGAIISTNGLERVRVDANGNVGINNPSPGNLGKFAVGDTNGTMFWAAPTAGFGDLGMVGGPGNSMRIGPAGYASGGASLMYTDASSIRKEALRADSSGHIFINLMNTSPTVAVGTAALQRVSNTAVRLHMRGSDNIQRYTEFTLTP